MRIRLRLCSLMQLFRGSYIILHMRPTRNTIVTQGVNSKPLRLVRFIDNNDSNHQTAERVLCSGFAWRFVPKDPATTIGEEFVFEAMRKTAQPTGYNIS